MVNIKDLGEEKKAWKEAKKKLIMPSISVELLLFR